jgi:hypothetical protein
MGDAVEVCPMCDIDGCHHIRAKRQRLAAEALSSEIPEGYGPDISDDPDFHAAYDAAIIRARADGGRHMTRAPIRIQLSRRKGFKKPEGALVVARPTKWGNPFKASNHGSGSHARDIAATLYDCWIQQPEQKQLFALAQRELRGRDLACWCPLNQPCHADVLLRIANE